ncbi:MAG TPA: recombination mediator RecR, partial [Patescibacteria group bacterium]|nr:recombination mediator RecR [Patescibacteria group bacterium]
LIRELGKLPGVGQKTAQRLAFFLLRKDAVDLAALSGAISQVKQGVVFCSVCHMMAESDPCGIDRDEKRDHSVVCAVEESLDALALDKTGQYKGVFHVLGGVLNPLEGIGPEQLEIESLMGRIRAGGIRELIVATNPTLEGETTSMHIAKRMKEFPGVKVTRIARGLPMGGDLEYADDITLMRALEGRREY